MDTRFVLVVKIFHTNTRQTENVTDGVEMKKNAKDGLGMYKLVLATSKVNHPLVRFQLR